MAARRSRQGGGGARKTRAKATTKPRKKTAKRSSTAKKTQGAARKAKPKAAARKASTARKKTTGASKGASRKATRTSKPTTRKAAAKKPTAKPRGARVAAGIPSPVGTVRHYYGRARAAVVDLEGELRVGDAIHVRGETTDFFQLVGELRLSDAKVRKAAGDSREPAAVGIGVTRRVRPGDRVYRVSW